MSDTDNLRKVEIQVGESWVSVQMKELEKGDIFRMTEPNELVPFGTWVATSDANDTYTNDDGEPTWGVNADLVEI